MSRISSRVFKKIVFDKQVFGTRSYINPKATLFFDRLNKFTSLIEIGVDVPCKKIFWTNTNIILGVSQEYNHIPGAWSSTSKDGFMRLLR